MIQQTTTLETPKARRRRRVRRRVEDIVTAEKHVEGGVSLGGCHVAALEGLVDIGGLRLFVGEGERRREEMVRERVMRGSGVDEVGASLDATHGSGGAVVGAGGFLSRVEGAEPPALLRLRVPYLGCVTAPRPPPDAAVPHGAAGAAVFSGRLLGGALLGVVGEGVGGIGFWNVGEGVEAPEEFFHG